LFSLLQAARASMAMSILPNVVKPFDAQFMVYLFPRLPDVEYDY
jgi:hypothetical protein